MLPLMLNLYVSRLKEAGAPLHPRIDSEIANHLGYVDGALKGSEFFVGNSLTGADIQMSFVGEMAKVFDKLGPLSQSRRVAVADACAAGVPALGRKGRGVPVCEVGRQRRRRRLIAPIGRLLGLCQLSTPCRLKAAELFSTSLVRAQITGQIPRRSPLNRRNVASSRTFGRRPDPVDERRMPLTNASSMLPGNVGECADTTDRWHHRSLGTDLGTASCQERPGPETRNTVKSIPGIPDVPVSTVVKTARGYDLRSCGEVSMWPSLLFPRTARARDYRGRVYNKSDAI